MASAYPVSRIKIICMAKGKISIASPVGKGLLGHEVGDVVEISVPAGKIPFEILEISRQ